MENNKLKITVSISKTIQEKQFEPLVVSYSITLDTDDESLETDISDATTFLEDRVKETFANRGLK